MSDGDARAAAVDPARSVIVQAPAGSGKTTLLVERYLTLLGVVQAPEEILAITFTRKAAAEMRERVLRYLDPDYASTESHEQAPLAKARAVRHKVTAWALRDNPQRLLIRTIDSFNHYLARTMPVASALGPVPTPADDTRALYRRAARRVLALVDDDDPLAADLELLLDWRDHKSQDIEDLLSALLGQRDQWLRALSVTGPPHRERLERVLEMVVGAQLEASARVLRESLATAGVSPGTLLELLRHAGRTLIEEHRDSPIAAFAHAPSLPGPGPDTLPLWRGLGEALLTRPPAPGFRRSVTITQGFRPRTTQKDAFTELLQRFEADARLQDAVQRARSLPPPRYRDEEWAVLDALVRVLNRAAGELELVFAASGQTDYTGLAAAALRGLGDEDHGVTDLGLYLDRRIRHLLVDEFQDTNWGQLHLLEKLTSGWEPGDGKSLFLVGDPMQSIYRFREAEVGLFIRSRDLGVGSLALESQRLTNNFRSRAEIVDWVNGRLGPIFPRHEDIAAGAVAYAPSEPTRGSGGAVDLLAHPSDTLEAEAVARLLETTLKDRADDPAFRAAVIVRARSHLKDLIPALNRRGIGYRAVKLDPLTERPVVQDLLALTRAIVLPADRAALLALLRAPFCGLTLADLHALAAGNSSLEDPSSIERLEPSAGARARRVFDALERAREQWRRRPTADLVEGAWTALGGPACLTRPATDLRDARLYLGALELAEGERLLDDWNGFLELLDGRHTEGDPPSAGIKLDILTMHGAKGLEWDLVILPGLNRRSGGVESTLLHWLPFTTAEVGEQVLLAPLRSADEAQNPPLINLIRGEQQTRAAFEHQRLLYVACTRARERLILSAALEAGEAPPKPMTGSLLADLWPTTGRDFEATLADTAAQVTETVSGGLPDQTLRRVAGHWRPSHPPRIDWRPRLPLREATVDVEFNWAGSDARRQGTVLHRLLERVGRLGVENVDHAERLALFGRIPVLLRSLGLRDALLPEAAATVRDALERTLESTTGRWILSGLHERATCELPIAGLLDGELVSAVIDRTFVTTDGIRWIIDYKSGHHAGADLTGFLEQERERYRAQLNRYRRLFLELEQREVRAALYLPRHDALETVEP